MSIVALYVFTSLFLEQGSIRLLVSRENESIKVAYDGLCIFLYNRKSRQLKHRVN